MRLNLYVWQQKKQSLVNSNFDFLPGLVNISSSSSSSSSSLVLFLSVFLGDFSIVDLIWGAVSCCKLDEDKDDDDDTAIKCPG
jgi:hypothetical protein